MFSAIAATCHSQGREELCAVERCSRDESLFDFNAEEN